MNGVTIVSKIQSVV